MQKRNESRLPVVLKPTVQAQPARDRKQADWRLHSCTLGTVTLCEVRAVSNHIFKSIITSVSSHDEQENTIFCLPRWEDGAKCCSETNATDSCPTEQQVICQEEALPLARIKMLMSSEDNQPGLLVTHQRPWTIYSIFVPQLHLLKKKGLQPLPFFFNLTRML